SVTQQNVAQQSVTQQGVSQQSSVTLHSDAGQVKLVPALYTPPSTGQPKTRQPMMQLRNGKRPSPHHTRGAGLPPKLTATSDLMHEIPAPEGQPDVSGMVVLVLTNQIVVSRQAGSAGPDVMQVQVLELRWIVPANPHPKPIPRKT